MQCFQVVYHGISHKSLVFSPYIYMPLGKCVYQENISDKWDIPWYTMHERICLLNFVGKVGFNTMEYTTAFLCSDWLYFLWHGINVLIMHLKYFYISDWFTIPG